MKTWQVRGVGILAFFGSLAGIGLLTYFVVLIWPDFLSAIIFVPFLAAYVYGTYLGWQILRGVEGALSRSYPFWIAQVPID